MQSRLTEELRAMPKHRCKVNQDSTRMWIWFLGQRTGIFLGTVPRRGEEEGGSEMGEAALLGAVSCSQRECRQTVSASSVAHAHGIPDQCRHIPPHPVVDKTFTNSAREKCGHLYCRVVKLDISGAIGVHESQKEVKIQMDINVH